MVNNATTNSILRDKSHFLSTTHIPDKMITTITRTISFSQYMGDASIQLPNGIVLHLKDAIWALAATQNLLSFKDIHKNGFKIATQNEQYSSLLHILDEKSEVIETFKSYPSGVFTIPFYSIQEERNNTQVFSTQIEVWHSRLGHSGKL